MAGLTEPEAQRPGWLKRRLPRGLFGRALIIIVTPVVVLQLVAAIVFYDRHLDQVMRRLARTVTNDMVFLIDQLAATPGAEARADLLRRATARLNMAVRLDEGARLIPGQPPPAHPLERLVFQEIRDGLQRSYAIVAIPEIEAYRIDVPVPEGVLRVIVPFHRFTAPNASLVLYWSVGMSLVLLAIAILFMRNQVRPIRRLGQAAERSGRGHDDPPFKPAGATEVRQAALAFLVMRERIQRQIRQRTEMLAGVSHDLRTPLTRLRLEVEMLGATPGTADMRADIAEMEQMVEGYLAFARGADGEKAVETDVAGLVADVAEAARRAGADVTVAATGDLVMPVRPQALRRSLANLLDNARRFARHVRVSVVRDAGAVIITVDDDGPGIPDHLREEVFRPFYRIEGSRNPDTGGVGLGLAVARDAVRSHGGDVTLGDAPAGGLRAVVRLPLR